MLDPLRMSGMIVHHPVLRFTAPLSDVAEGGDKVAASWMDGLGRGMASFWVGSSFREARPSRTVPNLNGWTDRRIGFMERGEWQKIGVFGGVCGTSWEPSSSGMNMISGSRRWGVSCRSTKGTTTGGLHSLGTGTACVFVAMVALPSWGRTTTRTRDVRSLVGAGLADKGQSG